MKLRDSTNIKVSVFIYTDVMRVYLFGVILKKVFSLRKVFNIGKILTVLYKKHKNEFDNNFKKYL